jgi:hypothetical protein
MIPIAQVVAGYSLGQLAIFVVVVLALAGLVAVAVRAFGVSVPGWLVQVISIVIAAIIIIAAIRIVMSM